MTEQTRNRRRFTWLRFSLRSFLLVIAIIEIFLGLSCLVFGRAQKQRSVLTAVEQMGGEVGFDYDFDASANFISNATPPGPASSVAVFR